MWKWLCVVLALAGCSPIDFVNARAGVEGVVETRDVAYGPELRQRYDLYDPGGEGPVVVFVQGGAWSAGDKRFYRFIGTALAAEGWRVAVPNYRLAPRVVFPTFVEDVAAVVEAVRRDVAGGAPVWLVGHSAGAHIGALIVHDPHYLAALGSDPCGSVAGFVGIAGAYDFLPIEGPRFGAIFPEATRDASQPVNFGAGEAPPTLLLHGARDNIVDVEQAESFAKALRKGGNRVRLEIYRGVGHLSILGALGEPFRGQAPTLDSVRTFIEGAAPGCR
ncbi:alpha/beta hydrolase [Pontivivens ytuae]|uniref:Alpha/beta hydrolase n=1 Tax=Pontivivens ytuae TaxID=2789856 RepID=A0A7S9LPG2_9RHOB|nr:alpha/beta hydrolase [Pontivivens ytuae]QPH52849.1 alpha/beta hydrolase [Pontivivens ytuae]